MATKATTDLFSYQAANASAKAQMEFQERMSNTAHQREVEDLKKAGLNPILSAGGSGASTPTGAEGAVGDENAKLWDMMNQLVDTVASSSSSSGKAVSRMVNNVNKLSKDLSKVIDKIPKKTKQELIYTPSDDVDAELQKNFELAFGSRIPSWMKNSWSDVKNVLYSDDPKTAVEKEINGLINLVDRAVPVLEQKNTQYNSNFFYGKQNVKRGVSSAVSSLKNSARKVALKAEKKAGSYGSLNSNWYS